MARMPNYRAQLVHYLPKLEVLDTRAVARGERQAATLTIRKEAPLQVSWDDSSKITCSFFTTTHGTPSPSPSFLHFSRHSSSFFFLSF